MRLDLKKFCVFCDSYLIHSQNVIDRRKQKAWHERRDWIELHLRSMDNVDRLATLVATAMAENV